MTDSEFVKYHRDTLPHLLQAGRDVLLRGQRLPTLGISLSGQRESFSYRIDEAGLTILPGVEGADIHVELTASDWRGLVDDLESVPGILYGGRVASHSGDLMNFVRWEPALRALYTGRRIYDPASFVLRDGAGRALAPDACFSLDSPAVELRNFLDAAGYLLVSDVFTQEEIQLFREAACEISAAAEPGDQHSWWGRDESGTSILCRCLNAGSHPVFAHLYDDSRLRCLADLLPTGMLHPAPHDKDGVTVIYKNPGVSEGLSDLPWHRDCGMGGHANMCPTYILSVYLYAATREQGPLQFLPGSHRFAYGFADAGTSNIPGAVTVPAKAGDVTLHIGDVMHAAPPPISKTGPFRQSVLLSFHPDFAHHRGERHYNDVLLGADDGQVRHLRNVVEP